ncbi:helix-turn-helix protein [Magnetospirillum gryphiswaldense MSR-1]|nr:helix-turn-helix protein [Magnetospirillum gryphiswaldense MSR-1]AVM79974.1 helix-turn-helix protein [Magnetospirillum gryphiswaldense]
MGTRHKYDPAYRAIVDGLIAARKARGLTQIDVAQAMGTDQSQISKFERGERRLDILDYVRYAAAVGERPGPLLDRLMGCLFPDW